MSINNVGILPSYDTSSLARTKLPAEYNEVSTVTNTWKRNPSWRSLPSNPGFVEGLYAIYPDMDNFLAITATTSGGNFSIDYEAGTLIGNGTAYLNLDYNNVAYNNTNAPVTFVSNTISRNNHGYSNGDIVRFYNITGSPPISEHVAYYVVNSTINTFEISNTSGGSSINMGAGGSATLLPYKIARITIGGFGSFLLTVNLSNKHNQTNLVSGYTTGWLDLNINCATLTNFTLNSANVRHQFLENVTIDAVGAVTSMSGWFSAQRNLCNATINSNLGSVTDMSSMFSGCYNLLNVNFTTSTASVTNTSLMFRSCFNLRSAPFFNTSNVTNTSQMFDLCNSLDSVPLYDTSKVTNANNMFNGCGALKNVPPFNLKELLNMESMFGSCSSLTDVPLFDTSKVTNMRGVFLNCTSLKSVPHFNTSSVTNMAILFSGCSSLKSIPQFNTVNITSMFQTFYGCGSLKTIPPLNTGNVTSFSQTFYNCTYLETIPELNTASATTTSNMFYGCNSLTTIPLLNTSNVTDMSSMFANCSSLTSVPLLDTSKATLVNSMFSGCPNLKIIPKFNLAVATNTSNMFANCTAIESSPIFNMPLASNLSSMYSGCINLRNIAKLSMPAATNVSAMFTGCSSLIRVPDILPVGNLVTTSAGLTNIFNGAISLSKIDIMGMNNSFSIGGCRFNKNALDQLFSNLPRVTNSAALTITSNYGSDTTISKTCSVTAGSKIMTVTDTSSLVVGMRITGAAVSTSISVTFQDTGDTVTYNNHGLSDGTIVYFSSITTTTGILTYTSYYVVNSTTNTFQLASSNGGLALPLTNNGYGVMFYPTYIVSIVPNTSITMSAPASSTGSISYGFKILDTYPALVKGWSVTG